MVRDILFAAWFLLPAAVANAAPILSSKTPALRRLDAPIDGGHTFRGKRVLGTHKTWRGLASGMLVATLVFWMQQTAVRRCGWAQRITQGTAYSALPTFILGPLFGLGALGGDAVESFFKRQRGVPSGKKWVPFDQTDYVLGAVLVTLPFVILSFVQYVWIAVIWTTFHFVANYFGWLVGLKEDPI